MALRFSTESKAGSEDIISVPYPQGTQIAQPLWIFTSFHFAFNFKFQSPNQLCSGLCSPPLPNSFSSTHLLKQQSLDTYSVLFHPSKPSLVTSSSRKLSLTRPAHLISLLQTLSQLTVPLVFKFNHPFTPSRSQILLPLLPGHSKQRVPAEGDPSSVTLPYPKWNYAPSRTLDLGKGKGQTEPEVTSEGR